MSNEQLACLIKDGNKEYMAILWEQMKKLLYLQANRFYNKYSKRCTQCGVTLEDLHQECYIVLYNMVQAYDREKPFTLCSYSTFQINNTFMREMLGVYGDKDKQPLSSATSLDNELKGLKSDNVTLLDTIPDRTAGKEFENVNELMYREQLHNTLDNAMNNALTDKQKQVIEGRYYNGDTLKTTADKLGVSIERSRRIEYESLKALRRYSYKDKKFNELHQDIISYHGTGMGSFLNRQASSVEWTVERILEKSIRS